MPARPWDETEADAIIRRHAGREGPLLPVLHALQENFGFISDSAIRLVANRLNLSRAEVFGVVSFYHDFRRAPAGRHVLKICRAEACQAMGAEAQSARLLKNLGLAWGETTADGRLTVEPVYCLGLCACAPSALLDGQVHGRLDGAMLDSLARNAA